MKIRSLQRADYGPCFALLKEFAQEIGNRDLILENPDVKHIYRILLRCEISTASFVAEHDRTIQGMILALVSPDIWFPNQFRISELAWFVRPEYRHTTMGARLFHHYEKSAQNQVKSGKIRGCTISKLANSPDFDYEKRGFEFVEATYQQGAR